MTTGVTVDEFTDEETEEILRRVQAGEIVEWTIYADND